MKGHTRVFVLGVAAGLVLAACLAFAPGREDDAKQTTGVVANPLREYANSEEYLHDLEEFRRAAEAWPFDKLKQEFVVIERMMREEVLWSKFLDACMVHAARATSDAKLKQRWKPYQEACSTLTTYSFATWLGLRENPTRWKSENQPAQHFHMAQDYAIARIEYPKIRAQRLALTRAIIDHVYYGDYPEMAEKEHPAWELAWDDWLHTEP